MVATCRIDRPNASSPVCFRFMINYLLRSLIEKIAGIAIDDDCVAFYPIFYLPYHSVVRCSAFCFITHGIIKPKRTRNNAMCRIDGVPLLCADVLHHHIIINGKALLVFSFRTLARFDAQFPGFKPEVFFGPAKVPYFSSEIRVNFGESIREYLQPLENGRTLLLASGPSGVIRFDQADGSVLGHPGKVPLQDNAPLRGVDACFLSELFLVGCFLRSPIDMLENFNNPSSVNSFLLLIFFCKHIVAARDFIFRLCVIFSPSPQQLPADNARSTEQLLRIRHRKQHGELLDFAAPCAALCDTEEFFGNALLLWDEDVFSSVIRGQRTNCLFECFLQALQSFMKRPRMVRIPDIKKIIQGHLVVLFPEISNSRKGTLKPYRCRNGNDLRL